MNSFNDAFRGLSVFAALIGAIAAAAFICCVVFDVNIVTVKPNENAVDMIESDSKVDINQTGSMVDVNQTDITADANPTDSGTETYLAGNETAAELIDRYITGELPILSIDELDTLDGLQVVRFDDRNCAVAYNDAAVWVFDYQLMQVCLLADLDILLAYVDPTGNAARYFENAYIDYTIEESKNKLDVTCKVTSKDDSGCVFTVGSDYYAPADEGSGFTRGRLSYRFIDITYPGSTEPISVDSVDRLDLLCPDINPNQVFVDLLYPFVTNDTDALEELLGLDRGTLSDWEGMVISDYSICREMPLMTHGEYSLEFTIADSGVERYPAGRYVMTSNELPETYDIVSLDAEPTEYQPPADADEDAIYHAYNWGTSFAGCFSEEAQNPEDPAFAHLMLDYLLWIAREKGYDNDAFTGNDYREYAAKYLNYTGFENEYTAYGGSRLNHGGHGFNFILGEVTGYEYRDGLHYVTVSCYADQFKSVIAKIHTYAVEKTDDGLYAIIDTEFVYESGLPMIGWGV